MRFPRLCAGADGGGRRRLVPARHRRHLRRRARREPADGLRAPGLCRAARDHPRHAQPAVHARRRLCRRRHLRLAGAGDVAARPCRHGASIFAAASLAAAAHPILKPRKLENDHGSDFAASASASLARWATSCASRTATRATSCCRKGKALRATEANKSKFEGMKSELHGQEHRDQGRRRQDRQQARRQVLPGDPPGLGDRPALRLGVAARSRHALLTENGFEVDRNQIALNVPIKTIGQHKVPVHLHPEVEVTVTVNVARSADEAERLARGENVTVRREGGDDAEDEAEAAKAAAEAVVRAGRGRSRDRRRRRRACGRQAAERLGRAPASLQSKISYCFGAGGGEGAGAGSGSGTAAGAAALAAAAG